MIVPTKPPIDSVDPYDWGTWADYVEEHGIKTKMTGEKARRIAFVLQRWVPIPHVPRDTAKDVTGPFTQGRQSRGPRRRSKRRGRTEPSRSGYARRLVPSSFLASSGYRTGASSGRRTCPKEVPDL